MSRGCAGVFMEVGSQSDEVDAQPQALCHRRESVCEAAVLHDPTRSSGACPPDFGGPRRFFGGALLEGNDTTAEDDAYDVICWWIRERTVWCIADAVCITIPYRVGELPDMEATGMVYSSRSGCLPDAQ